MPHRPFVHLHCHTHYSLLDGASKVPDLVERVRGLGMGALAVTDHGNLHGASEFLRVAKGKGVKPIVGLEAYVAPGHRTERTTGGGSGHEYAFHLTLLARNGEGVRNLMRLSSKSFLEGFYYKPRIDKEILERHSEGLICLSGCASAEFSDLILHGKTAEAEALCAWYQKIFGPENFYVEIQDNGIQIQRDCKVGALDIANRMGLPVVATSDAHYLTQDDAPAHDILLCINTGKTFDDPNRMRFENDQFHVRTQDEMYEAMPGHEEALATSARIADLVEDDYKSLDLGRRQFPSFQTPPGRDADAYLRELCETGLVDRYGATVPTEARERLDHELGVIARMGFSSYFLIVWDFVRFAREQGIPNSARGSACGALVSYLLHLSHVDPIEYDLLFERFLDPNRSEAPDIDIDLCKDRRYEVIEYVKRKYGTANVAQIGTFMTMAAKAALKDVGRTLGIPLLQIDQITKLVPQRLNITLTDALAEEPQLRRMTEENPEIEKLFNYARRLEGSVRNVSTHAAGVVIADRPLESLVPLQKLAKEKDSDLVITQWTMNEVEKAGLLKMDFLGLRNLTSLALAVQLIERKIGHALDLNKLPLDDPETFALLQRGDVKGVFQLDGAGIRDLVVKMKPDRFGDLSAILALYRPGPLNGGMVDSYVNRKHGREVVTYEHPVMKEVLEETYGVMVYQEQVMRILNRLGGVELSRAYATIKAISKKKTEVIAGGRKEFLEGAVASGLEKERAVKIFDLIEFFGGYGFNKSHTTAYALVAYQTAYLKAHHPTEFMAAILSSEMDGAEREKYFVEHVEDCRKMGMEVLTPDVNSGELQFATAGEGRIHFGLGAIKGVGFKAVEEVLRARSEGGPFAGLDDFFERVSAKICSQGCTETLIKAGAFDCLGARRSQLLAVLPRVVQAGQARQEDRKRGQRNLFDAFGGDSKAEDVRVGTVLPDIPELPEADRLAEEKAALGFYMTSHPLARHESTLMAFRTHAVAELAELPDKVEATVGGIIQNVKTRNVSKSRSGLTRMVKFSFEDLGGSVAAMCWPEEFARNEHLIANDAIVFVKGTMNRSREPAELVVSRVIPVEEAAAQLARGLVVTLRKGVHQPSEVERILRLVRTRPGNLDLFFEITGLEQVRRAIYRAGASLKVRHDDHLVTDLEAAVGTGNVRLLGHRGSVARPEATQRRVPTPAPEPALETESEIDGLSDPDLEDD